MYPRLIMKKTLMMLALLSGALPAVAFSFPTPSATLTRFEVAAISLRDVTFLFELTVNNPYPVDLSFNGMDLIFKVEGEQVFTADSRGGFSVPGHGTKANAFTVKLAYEEVIKVVADYSSKDFLNTVVDGTLDIPLPRFPGLPRTWSFSFSQQKMIPAVKPRVSLLDFSVKPPTRDQVKDALVKGGSHADPGMALGVLQNVLRGREAAEPVIDPSDIDVPVSVSFTIELANEARAELAFAKLGYELAVNGEKLVAGESTEIVRKAGRSRITVVSTFSSRSLSKNVREVFSSGKGTFSLHGTASIKLPDEISKAPLPLDFQEGGDFSVK